MPVINNLRHQHGPISHFPRSDTIHGLVDLAHRKRLDHRLDAVLGGEFQHFRDVARAAAAAAGDALLAADSDIAAIFKSESGTPTIASRPSGRSAATIAAQFTSAETVERIKSNDPLALANSSSLFVAMNWLAPILRASSSLE